MSRLLRGALSLENDNNDYEVDEVSLESTTLSLVESALTLEHLDYELDILGEAGDKAMSLEDHLENMSLESSDMTPIELTMESIGITMESDTPLLEDKRGGVKKFIQKVWAAIKRTIKKLAEAFKEFIKNLFDGVTRLKKKVDTMEAEFESFVKEKQLNPKETGDVFKVATSVANHLSPKGDWSKEAIDDGVSKILKITSKLDDITQHTATTYVALEQHLSKWKDEKDGGSLDDLKLDINNKKFRAATVSLKDTVLPGGKEFVLWYPGATPWELNNNKAQHYQFHGVLQNSDEVSSVDIKDTSIDPLTIDDINTYFNTLNGFLDTILGNRKGVEKLKKQRESFNKAADQWVSSLEKGKIGKFISKVQLKQHMNMIRHNGQRTVTELNRYLYTYCVNLAKLISASIKSVEDKVNA